MWRRIPRNAGASTAQPPKTLFEICVATDPKVREALIFRRHVMHMSDGARQVIDVLLWVTDNFWYLLLGLFVLWFAIRWYRNRRS